MTSCSNSHFSQIQTFLNVAGCCLQTADTGKFSRLHHSVSIPSVVARTLKVRDNDYQLAWKSLRDVKIAVQQKHFFLIIGL